MLGEYPNRTFLTLTKIQFPIRVFHSVCQWVGGKYANLHRCDLPGHSNKKRDDEGGGSKIVRNCVTTTPKAEKK